jgi:hypothetical protein
MAHRLVALIVALFLAIPVYAAQAGTTAKKAPRPTWAELSPAQQDILRPLQEDWESLDTARRKKWVAITDRYPKMKPAEQQRLHKRMQEWAKLTPAERAAAREKYQTLRKLPPEKRQEFAQQWEQYQQSRTPQGDAAPGTAPTDATAGTN